jgi:hypothetical protein
MNTPIRILHCPTAIGGNPQGLAKAERTLGLASHSVIFRQNYLQYKVDEVLLPDKGTPLQLEIKRWQLLRRALREYDIVHFNFGETIFPRVTPAENAPTRLRKRLYLFYLRILELRDLPILKRAGKGIVMTFQGDDARQGDYQRANFAINIANEVDNTYYSPGSDAHKRWRIDKISRFADMIFALNPDLLHVLPSHAEFLPYANIDLNDWKPVIDRVRSGPPLVVHAPSHRGAKGTRFVLDSIERIKKDGIPIEFILVEGLTHTEARNAYEKADILIDQLLAGWYGGLAVELMALAKPVVCYIRNNDLRFIPDGMKRDLPLINATPDTLYQVMRDLLTARRQELPLIGQDSRRYVEKWHDPIRIAMQLKAVYESIYSARH